MNGYIGWLILTQILSLLKPDQINRPPKTNLSKLKIRAIQLKFRSNWTKIRETQLKFRTNWIENQSNSSQLPIKLNWKSEQLNSNSDQPQLIINTNQLKFRSKWTENQFNSTQILIKLNWESGQCSSNANQNYLHLQFQSEFELSCFNFQFSSLPQLSVLAITFSKNIPMFLSFFGTMSELKHKKGVKIFTISVTKLLIYMSGSLQCHFDIPSFRSRINES